MLIDEGQFYTFSHLLSFLREKVIIMAINVDALTPHSSDTPVRTSSTIDRPSDTRRADEARNTDKDNVTRADERRLQENQASKEARTPTRSQEGNLMGLNINTSA